MALIALADSKLLLRPWNAEHLKREKILPVVSPRILFSHQLCNCFPIIQIYFNKDRKSSRYWKDGYFELQNKADLSIGVSPVKRPMTC